MPALDVPDAVPSQPPIDKDAADLPIASDVPVGGDYDIDRDTGQRREPEPPAIITVCSLVWLIYFPV